jgi:hypothetical protein
MAGTVGWGATRVLLVLALPFVILVRGSVYLFAVHGWYPWLALLGAAGAALGLVTLYGVWVVRHVSGKSTRPAAVARWVAAPLVLGYCGYALLYLSRVNAKTDAVRSAYTATHPLLRLAVSTLVLVDGDVVVTDLARDSRDYGRMGLAPNPRSRHFPQADGWVHALDIRTAGRGRVANWMVEGYFRVMGFDTLRHAGTADHLHVELRRRA